ALERAMPDARIELDFQTPLELLVAVILSAQCTDRRVNLVTPALFARFRTPADYARARPEEVEPYIRTCGLFRNKARALVAACRAIVAEHGGEVPTSRAALASLPGVGNKSAGVVALNLTGEPALPVDTHVARLAQRMGLTRERAPDRIERDLQRLLPPETWNKGHHLLIWHGRRTCEARAPRCGACAVAALCPRRGVGRG
ncbi:MAG: endonuclease III, partial [Myxococcales bacterium]